MLSRFFIYLLLIIVMPTVVMAKYCVQVSSVRTIDKNYILKQAESKVFKNESNVRVEKTGNYFSLRIGNFANNSEAQLSLDRIKSMFPDAFIRKCTYRPQSIIYSLEDNSLAYKHIAKEKNSITYLPPNYEN